LYKLPNQLNLADRGQVVVTSRWESEGQGLESNLVSPGSLWPQVTLKIPTKVPIQSVPLIIDFFRCTLKLQRSTDYY